METLEKVKETLEYHKAEVKKLHIKYQILLKETRKKELIELIQNKYFQVGVNTYYIKSVENIYDSDYMECIADAIIMSNFNDAKVINGFEFHKNKKIIIKYDELTEITKEEYISKFTELYTSIKNEYDSIKK